jgi:hypothetical protein
MGLERFYTASQVWGDVVEEKVDAVVEVLFFLDGAGFMELGDEIVLVVGEEDLGEDGGSAEVVLQGLEEGFGAFSGLGAKEDAIGDEVFEFPPEGVATKQVGLVENGNTGLFVGMEFRKDFEGGFEMCGGGRVGCVEDVDEDIRDQGFFQRGLEGLDEPVGEATDEADGVRGDEVAA